MSSERLAQPARSKTARNDLRAELNDLWRRNHQLYQRRESEGPIVLGDIWVQLGDDPKQNSFYEGAPMPRRVFDRLVEHERRFGRISRTSDEDYYASGMVVSEDNSWPFCSECLLPLVTMLNGHPGQGVWVEPIADAAEVCACCWLAEHYDGDHDRMIEHVVRVDIGDEIAQAFLRNDVLRGIRAGRLAGDYHMALCNLALVYFESAGLFELLRLHRVSVREAATVIVRVGKTTLGAIQAARRWRDARLYSDASPRPDKVIYLTPRRAAA